MLKSLPLLSIIDSGQGHHQLKTNRAQTSQHMNERGLLVIFKGAGGQMLLP